MVIYLTAPINELLTYFNEVWFSERRENDSRNGRSEENMDLVRANVFEEPEISISRRSQQFGLSMTYFTKGFNSKSL